MPNRFNPPCNCCGCSEQQGNFNSDVYDAEIKTIRYMYTSVVTRTVVTQRTETYSGGVRTGVSNITLSDTTTTVAENESTTILEQGIAGQFEWRFSPVTSALPELVQQSTTGNPPTDGTITYQPRTQTTRTETRFEAYRMIAKIDLSGQYGIGELDGGNQPYLKHFQMFSTLGVYVAQDFTGSNINGTGGQFRYFADLEDFPETIAEFDETWNATGFSTNIAATLNVAAQMPATAPQSLWVLAYSTLSRRGRVVSELRLVLSGIQATSAGSLSDWRKHWYRLSLTQWKSKFTIPDNHYRFTFDGSSHPIQIEERTDRQLVATVEGKCWKVITNRNPATPPPAISPNLANAQNRFNIAYTGTAALSSGYETRLAVFDVRAISRIIGDPISPRSPWGTNGGGIRVNVSDDVIGWLEESIDVIETDHPRGNAGVTGNWVVSRGPNTREENDIIVTNDTEHPFVFSWSFTKIRGNIETVIIDDDPEDDIPPEVEEVRWLSTRPTSPGDDVENPRCPIYFPNCWDVELETKRGVLVANMYVGETPSILTTNNFGINSQRDTPCLTSKITSRTVPYPYGYVDAPYPSNPFSTLLFSGTLNDGSPFDVLMHPWFETQWRTGTISTTPTKLTVNHSLTRTLTGKYRSAFSATAQFLSNNSVSWRYEFARQAVQYQDVQEFDEPITQRSVVLRPATLPLEFTGELGVNPGYGQDPNAPDFQRDMQALKVYRAPGVIEYFTLRLSDEQLANEAAAIEAIRNPILFGGWLPYDPNLPLGSIYDLFSAGIDISGASYPSAGNFDIEVSWTTQ